MRTKNVSRNAISGLLEQLLLLLLRFTVRTVFIYTLTKEYLGISGLFVNILNVLNIAELGFGSAIGYALYKPLANHDIEQIRSLMALYKKAYHIIGVCVLAIGLSLMPFLPRLIKESTDLVNIYVVFALYLLNSVSGYFFFAYKSAILSADQKLYFVNIFQAIAKTVSSIACIVSLLLLRNRPALSFYIYILIDVFGNIAGNIMIAIRSDKTYPYLNSKNVRALAPNVKQGIRKNIVALSISRISRVMLNSIDSIVIAMTLYQGVSFVAIYSNYQMIIAAITSFFSILSASLTSSLGNLYVTETVDRNKEVFNALHLVYTWSYGFCAICIWNLINPFVGGIWINKDWMLSDQVAFLLGFNLLIDGLMAAPIKYIQAAGLYWQAKLRYILSAVLNVGLSFLFVLKFGWGIEGVLFATTICMFAMVSCDPYIVFKHVFRESPLRFYLKYVGSFLLVLATGALTKWICACFLEYNLLNFVLRVLCCLIVPNALWLLLFYRTKEFQTIKATVLTMLHKAKE